MVAPDVVAAKIRTIQRCLDRLADVERRRPQLEPLDYEDLTALLLQRAVQAAIDLASHVATSEGYGPPDSTAEFFSLLWRHGILSKDLADRLQKMVGFRNISIHEYQNLNPAIVDSILEHHLDDLRALGEQVIRHFGLAE